MMVTLRISRASEILLEHHFVVSNEGDIARYAKTAIERFVADFPNTSLLDPEITLKFIKEGPRA